jgi:ABC-type polysaccharide/polyol phosphate transport system ATPase subunit
MSPAIELDRVGKRYWQLSEQAMLLKSLLPLTRPKRSELWAVRGATATIERGQTVGVLGGNGAGKTTLLRLLAGVTRPTEGRARIRGRVAPLISVGVGFHHEMSGRENVYVNGMLLGLSRAEVSRRFDAIVAFAELAEFIDTPVKFYSSGMFMRLGFAVAAHVDPDVLLVDEVLAVGDVAFQLKCLDHMRSLQVQGTTVVIVSHAMAAIRLLCPRVILLRKGGLVFDGDAETAISRHHELLTEDAAGVADGEASVRVASRLLVGRTGPTHHPDQDDELIYSVGLEFGRAVESPQLVFHVITETGIIAYSMQTTIGRRWQRFEAGETVEARIAFRPRLGGGTYRLTLVVTDTTGNVVIGGDPSGFHLYMAPRLGTSGVADLAASIAVGDSDLTDHDALVLRGLHPAGLPEAKGPPLS